MKLQLNYTVLTLAVGLFSAVTAFGVSWAESAPSKGDTAAWLSRVGAGMLKKASFDRKIQAFKAGIDCSFELVYVGNVGMQEDNVKTSVLSGSFTEVYLGRNSAVLGGMYLSSVGPRKMQEQWSATYDNESDRGNRLRNGTGTSEHFPIFAHSDEQRDRFVKGFNTMVKLCGGSPDVKGDLF